MIDAEHPYQVLPLLFTCAITGFIGLFSLWMALEIPLIATVLFPIYGIFLLVTTTFLAIAVTLTILISWDLNTYQGSLLQSIYRTLQTRRFLSKSVSYGVGTIPSLGYRSYSRACSSTVVEVRKNQVIFFMRLPLSHEGQRFVKELIPDLVTELSYSCSGFFFSTPERQRNELWIVGSKK